MIQHRAFHLKLDVRPVEQIVELERLSASTVPKMMILNAKIASVTRQVSLFIPLSLSLVVRCLSTMTICHHRAPCAPHQLQQIPQESGDVPTITKSKLLEKERSLSDEKLLLQHSKKKLQIQQNSYVHKVHFPNLSCQSSRQTMNHWIKTHNYSFVPEVMRIVPK